MRTLDARLLVPTGALLAEGIQWNARDARLWWTDIHGRLLLSCDADGGDLRSLALEERLTAFAFRETRHEEREDAILAAFASGLFRARPAHGRATAAHDVRAGPHRHADERRALRPPPEPSSSAAWTRSISSRSPG